MNLSSGLHSSVSGTLCKFKQLLCHPEDKYVDGWDEWAAQREGSNLHSFGGGSDQALDLPSPTQSEAVIPAINRRFNLPPFVTLGIGRWRGPPGVYSGWG